MAGILPEFILLKSIYDKYVYYVDSGDHAYCGEENVFNPFTKIAVERAKVNPDYIHLRFCHSNKYLRCASANPSFICATSDQPDEGSDWSSTLFKPYFAEDGLIRLTEVRGGMFLMVCNMNSRHKIYVTRTDGHEGKFSVVDWDSLVVMPPRVALKGDNGKYLKALTDFRSQLQFSSVDGNDEYSPFSVQMNPDGHVRFKSEFFGRFWKCNGEDLVYPESTDEKGTDDNTLFWPVKVNDYTIALRSHDRFCCRHGAKDLLSAASHTIANEAKLVVEELVLERSIYNIRYRMEDARVFDEQPIVAGIGTADNNSDRESTMCIKVSYEKISSACFTKSESLKGTVKTNFKTGIPFLAEGKIEVSAEGTVTRQWADTDTERKVTETSYTVRVPPMSRVTVNYVATKGTCNVPFSYIQRDKSSTDGRYVSKQHIDGIFNGVSYHSFHFLQLPYEPL